ncbi:signal transduction histidine kinase [Rhodoligotrophos appendicifer]|uniref:sensor histidine kinase n=1 Tax=Rhodoligotrophos appendicifer TaxID=987056 RepID=UPI00147903CE|nr:HAMP domain-containing sensor histidine kinase [Rhodoligotrophos appendicifer]
MSSDSDLLRLNQELRQAIQARDDFLAVAAHELRNPMHALLLQVKSALKAAHRVDDADLIKRVERIQVILERYVSRATTLLDVSRINAERLELKFEDVDLCQVLEHVAQSYELDASFNESALRISMPNALYCRCDRLAFEQIASNLVSNAIRYGHGKPTRISLSGTGEEITLVVQDQGPGIAAEDQARIFGRFEQVMSGTPRGGFGIGLWLVNALVLAHNGSIGVDSVPGEGATFTVRLPAKPNSAHRIHHD